MKTDPINHHFSITITKQKVSSPLLYRTKVSLSIIPECCKYLSKQFLGSRKLFFEQMSISF